jgi:hypothetical protein
MPASLLLHVPIVAALLLPAARFAPPPPVASISVELLSPRQLDPGIDPTGSPATGRAAAQPPAPPLGRAPPAPALDHAAAPTPAMIRATSMLSAAALADPRSREATLALAQMDDTERLVQLCNVEAMSQVRGWRKEFEPDQVVAYATSEIALDGRTVVADGAAFRSRRQWFRLRFRCKAAGDPPAVAAFEFLVGDAIPKDRWESYNLPDGDMPAAGE